MARTSTTCHERGSHDLRPLAAEPAAAGMGDARSPRGERRPPRPRLRRGVRSGRPRLWNIRLIILAISRTRATLAGTACRSECGIICRPSVVAPQQARGCSDAKETLASRHCCTILANTPFASGSGSMAGRKWDLTIHRPARWSHYVAMGQTETPYLKPSKDITLGSEGPAHQQLTELRSSTIKFTLRRRPARIGTAC